MRYSYPTLLSAKRPPFCGQPRAAFKEQRPLHLVSSAHRASHPQGQRLDYTKNGPFLIKQTETLLGLHGASAAPYTC
jgi:hypothetical protein